MGPRGPTAYRRQYRRPNYPVFRTIPYSTGRGEVVAPGPRDFKGFNNQLANGVPK